MAYISYPECGKIVNTHGCHGAVKVEHWCDSPEVFAALPAVYIKKNGDYQKMTLKHASVFKRMVFAEFVGVDTMEAADALRGTVLYAKRSDLPIPEGALLVAELIGLPVKNGLTDTVVGTIFDVIHPGATDIYVIKTDRGDAMVPVVPEFVRSVDPVAGIVITPIEGMLP